jgi:hypothetical protein
LRKKSIIEVFEKVASGKLTAEQGANLLVPQNSIYYWIASSLIGIFILGFILVLIGVLPIK